MPGPMDALKKAETIQPGVSKAKEMIQNAIMGITDILNPLNQIPDPTDPTSMAMMMIPGKFVGPLVKNLKNSVLGRTLPPGYAGVIEEAIDRNPRVAAHLSDINTHELTRPFVTGEYQPMRTYMRDWATDPDLEKRLSQVIDQGGTSIYGSSIRLNPAQIAREAVDPRVVLRHEMGHAAQDIWNPEFSKFYTGYNNYTVNPFEFGARATEWNMDARLPLRARLGMEVNNARNLSGTPDMAEAIRHMNLRLKPQQKKIVLDPESKKYLIQSILGQ